MSVPPQEAITGARRRIVPLLGAACRDMPPGILLASVLINLLSLVLPLAVMQVYDRIVPRLAVETLAALMVVVAVVVIIEAMLRIARNHLITWSATRLAWLAYRELLGRLMSAPEDALGRESASRSLDRAQALMAYAEWHGSPSRLVLVDVPFVFLFIGLTAVIGGWLALIPIALFAILGVAAVGRSEKLRKASAERATEDMKVRDFLIETLTGITTVKAGAMEPQMLRRFERLQEGLAVRSATILRLNDEAQALAVLLSNLTQMTTVTLGAVLVIDGTLSVGTLACCVMLAGRAVQPLLRCFAVWNELQSVVVGLEKAAPLLALPPARSTVIADPLSGPLSIEIAGASLRQPGGEAIFEDLNLSVPAGTIVAISGRDGAGKSTLVDLICGRRQPTTGSIALSGLGFDHDGPRLRKAIALAQAGATAVRGTILENITMFRQGDAPEIAREAARLIGLDADIRRLPLGYDTPMAEGVSAELPAGFTQRVAIARAIARRPGLLILDEANGSLDIRADKLLADGLRRLKGHATILIVTNRPSFAAIADRIFRLENGRLVALGPPTQAVPMAGSAA